MNKIVTFSNSQTHGKLKLTEYMGELGYMKNGIFHRRTNFSATVMRHVLKHAEKIITFDFFIASFFITNS